MTTKKAKEIYIRWDEIRNHLSFAIKMIPDPTKFRRIIGVARGGLPCAAMACHMLGIQDVVSVQVKTYNDHHRKVPRMEYQVLPDTPIRGYTGSDTLIVDDICDTGETIGILKRLYPKASVLSVFVRKEKLGVPDYHGFVIQDDAWLIFPWEVEMLSNIG